MVLFKQQWRSDRWTILTWSVSVAVLTWLIRGIYQVFADTGTLMEFENLIRSMPPAARALMGPQNFAFFETFVAGMAYGGLISIIFIIFLCTYVPGLISQEIDRGSSEFLLSLPVRRRAVLGTKWLGLAISTAALAAVQWLSLVVVTGADARPIPYLWATANMYLLYLEVGTLLLLASVFIDEYPKSAGVCAGIVTGLFFLNAMTEESTGIVSAVREALPFARFDANAIIMTAKVPGADMAILAAGTVVLLYLAVRAFDAKQIAG